MPVFRLALCLALLATCLAAAPTGVLTGRVVGPAGKPVAGAALFSVEEKEEETEYHRSTSRSEHNLGETDEDGRFRLTLPSGPFTLRVVAAGRLSRKVEELEIPAGGETGPIEVVLEKEDIGTVLEGRVFYADGSPAPSIHLSVLSVEKKGVAPRIASGRTDAQGRYRVTVRGPGPYRVYAARAGAAGGGQPDATVELSEGVNPLDLRLNANVGVEVSGRVVDHQGAPVAMVFVEVLRDGSGIGATTAADGSFTLKQVPDGEFTLTARKSGFAEGSLPGGVKVAGKPVRGLEVQIPAGRLPALTGRLRGTKPADLRGMRIEAESRSIGALGFPRAGKINTDGTYRFPDVKAGLWKVTAVFPSGKRVSGEVQVEPGSQEDVVLDLDLRD
ncbi:MAG TPA: carboxypeptidase-like regulatory domain-containing protein [Thermoanaerobaculia bacterium]|nr:carboxypeptidase-like regulatory domain-containing protein [Thermoanaerobaculia bacterium]